MADIKISEMTVKVYDDLTLPLNKEYVPFIKETGTPGVYSNNIILFSELKTAMNKVIEVTKAEFISKYGEELLIPGAIYSIIDCTSNVNALFSLMFVQALTGQIINSQCSAITIYDRPVTFTWDIDNDTVVGSLFYKAVISQSGTSAPVEGKLIQNDFKTTPLSYGYADEGSYLLKFGSDFDILTKCLRRVHLIGLDMQNGYLIIGPSTDSQINFLTYDLGNILANNLLDGQYLEIEVLL